MAKSLSFGVLHVGTAFGISYALTGDLAIAGAITFVEPLANTVVHYFHDKHWPKLAAWGRALFSGRSSAWEAEPVR